MFSVKIREKANRTVKPLQLLSIISIAALALILGAATPKVWAGDEYCRAELDEAEVFFEYNFTDGDLGIHFFWDGEAWKWMIVKNKWGRAVLDVITQRQLRNLGLTEGFFESDEPELCDEDEEVEGAEAEEGEDCDIDDAIEEFQARFPEGLYRFRGRTLEDDCLLVGSSKLSHDLPAAPEIEELEEDDLQNKPFIIEWTQPAGDEKVVGYEAVAEMVINERTLKDTTTLPGWVRSVTVSPQFMRVARNAFDNGKLEEFKVEVLAIGKNGNKTIAELPLVEGD